MPDAPTHAVIVDPSTRLAPLTDLRPVYAIRTGIHKTVERWQYATGLPVSSGNNHGGPVLWLNGACVLPPEGAQALAPGASLVDERGVWLCNYGDEPGDMTNPTTASGARTIERVWEIITHRDACIACDMQTLPGEPVDMGAPMKIGDHPLHIDPGATVWPGVTFDCTAGPIYVGTDAVVRPKATLVGPCAILHTSTVLDGAVIRAGTVVGPRCKVNGEITGTIFEGLSNKAHDGFLGDAYVGEWCNLGASTVNSNLLNTYSEIACKPAPNEPRERTGLTFFGCVLGDHTKTAIGTRIMTGTVTGTGAMTAASTPMPAPTPPFAWHTDKGLSTFRWNKFEEVMRAAMKRRQHEPSDDYLAKLKELHAAELERSGAAS